MFSFILDYKVFFHLVLLRAGCNEIESNIVNCRMWIVAGKVKKQGKNENTKWENSKDRYGYMVLNI